MSTAQAFGSLAEQQVARILTDHGRSVKRQKQHSPFDLLVDNQFRVEVKAARIQGCGRFTANLHRHTELSEDSVDFYVIRLVGIPHCGKSLHLLLRAPVGTKTVQFSLRGLVSHGAPYIENFRRFCRGEAIA